MGLSIIILAAGQGKRMRSAIPKVLHPVGGRPLLAHVLQTAHQLDPDRVAVVYGHGGEHVKDSFPEEHVEWVLQDSQLGTGHAVQRALPKIPQNDRILVLYGDVPLIRAETLRQLLTAVEGRALGLLTAIVDHPAGYGRVIRDEAGLVCRVVEERDATSLERKIQEVNTGILVAAHADLSAWLAQVDNNNDQGEYYLTDCIALAATSEGGVAAVPCHDLQEIAGVNDKLQLAQLERAYQRRQATELMRAGATLADPARVDVRGRIDVGRDVSIDVNVVFEGNVRLGDGVIIGPNNVLRDCDLADGVEVLPNCVLEGLRAGRGCIIGPYTRVRPGTALANGVKLGNFVEVKKSSIAAESKVNHLSYVGDTTIGRNVNVGAGTITCNYDGANKHPTVIEDDVFIGSDTQLVAPVTVHAGATIGAGSTITHDAPADELTLSRTRQTTVEGWKRPQKKPKP